MTEIPEVIHAKDDEAIYSQTAAYIDGQPRPHSTQLARRIGETAATLMAGGSLSTTETSYHGEVTELEHTPQTYVEFLRDMDGETRKDVAFLTEKMQVYPSFADSVKAALSDANEDDDHFLGKGSNGSAFFFEQDGEKHAVKTGGVKFRNVRAFRRGENIEGISHLEAVNLDDAEAVMNLVPGTMPEEMSLKERSAIPPEHTKVLVSKAIEMYGAGLSIDPKQSNFLYDRQKGYGVIDYSSLESTPELTLADQVLMLREMIPVYKLDTGPHYDSPDYPAWAKDVADTRVVLLNGLLDILESDYPDILRQAAEEQAVRHADPSRGSSGFYPNSGLSDDTPLQAGFKARLLRLGLNSEENQAYQDIDVNDDRYSVIG